MSNDWNYHKVIELQNDGILLVEDGNHGEYRPRSNEFDGDVAFIRAADMSNGRVLFGTASKINQTALDRIRKGIGKSGDILFSHKGTVGKLALVPLNAPSFVCSPQTTFWRTLDENKLDRRFLYSYMHSSLFKNQWHSRKGETDMADYVSLTAQRELKVPLPPIEDQKAIAKILSSLDDKIELNRQMSATLEAMARVLFKAWFVDFEPVRANVENRLSESASPEIAKLFPSEFENDIPKGWQEKSLDEIANFLNGLALQKFPPESEDEFLPVIKIAQLRKGNTEGSDRASRNLSPQYIVKDGDVLFSWSGSLEVEIWCGGDGALNQHLFKVTSNNYPKWFYFLWTRFHLPEFREIAAHKATTMGHIQRQHLTNAKVLVPKPDTLLEMNKVFEPLISKLIGNSLESKQLSQIRDSLLPRLISGKIPVGKIENIAQGENE